jgi:hypothetical protein
MKHPTTSSTFDKQQQQGVLDSMAAANCFLCCSLIAGQVKKV